MNFFEQQEQARKRTSLLLVCYFLSIALTIGLIFVGLCAVWAGMNSYRHGPSGKMDLVPELFFGNFIGYLSNNLFLAEVAAGVFAIVFLGTVFKIIQIARGGRAVAELLGGIRIPADTNDPDLRRVLNVVEEMAIASGMAVPPVYYMAGERAINAFAAGFSTSDAVVAVTEGCVKTLSRDELQGVVAHEFSHVFNGDMRLNINLMGILHGLLLLYLSGEILLRICGARARYSYFSNSRKGDPRAFLMLVGIVLMVAGGIGVFFGNLIKSAISRQREFLADASAVQYTRNPSGIGGALKKIGGFALGSKLNANRAQEVSHMFFANGIEKFWGGLFATHPPLDERIKRIDPSFEGNYQGVNTQLESGDITNNGISALAGGALRSETVMTPQQVKQATGTITAASMGYANSVLASIPAEILDRAREMYGAGAIILALLVNKEQEVQDKQLDYLSRKADRNMFLEVMRVMPFIAELKPHAYLPLVEIAASALKSLSTRQYDEITKLMDTLIAADGRVTLFEFALKLLVTSRLDVHFGKRKPVKGTVTKFGDVQEQLHLILSCLCYAGEREASEAEKTFEAVKGDLGISEVIAGREAFNLKNIDQALKTLANLIPLLKERLIDAAVKCITFDKEITITESELLRAIAAALDCPVPPVFSGKTF